MAFVRFLLWFMVAIVVGNVPTSGKAKDLGIRPIAQQAPEWCWAAASEMVLSYYDVPNINPGGNYQCGVVGAQGGICSMNCGMCLNGGGTTHRVAAVMQFYVKATSMVAGFDADELRIRTTGILSPQRIIDTIDNDEPIIAGISPNSIPYPPGLGMSQHAVVIVGYEGDRNSLEVIVNDPYPYPFSTAPYLQVGGQMLQPGQYQLRYQYFVSMLHYGNSITFK